MRFSINRHGSGEVMTSADLENILRKVVREELEALLKRERVEAAGPVDVPVHVPSNTENPLLMNDAELKYAEGLLAEDERPILRMRVMAARLDAKGQRGSASKMRRRADAMEKRLRKRP